jgi:hypothetical protein
MDDRMAGAARMAVLELHLARVEERVTAWTRLRERLLAMTDSLRAGETASVDDVLADDSRAKALAELWRGLVAELSGGNHEIEGAVQRVWEQEGEQLVAQHETNPRMFECMAFIERVRG